MFKERLFSSIILLAVTILFVGLGGNVLFAGLLVISLIGIRELYRTLKLDKTILSVLGFLACIAYYLFIYFKISNYLLLFVLFILLLMLVYVVSFPKYNIEQIAYIFMGLFYVGIMLSYIYKVRILENGGYLVWLVFIGAWGSDTFAYITGMTIGKRKFLPKLSPKKTLEGCVGGVVGAAFVGFLYGLIFSQHFTLVSNPKVAFMIICGSSSIISQLGDLTASAIKRDHKIKDYGRLIPGHGGILDRFDSIIFVAPIVYYLITIVG